MRVDHASEDLVFAGLDAVLNENRALSFDELWSLLVSASSCSETPIFCILDALDEIISSQVVLEKMKRSLSSETCLRFCMTTRLQTAHLRALEDVCLGFEDCSWDNERSDSIAQVPPSSVEASSASSGMPNQRLLGSQIHIRPSDVQSDICDFIKERISNSRKLNRPNTIHMQEEVLERLSAKCDGMFLW